MKNILFLSIVTFYAELALAQWTSLNSGTSSNMSSVYFSSPDTGYAIGNNSNGGEIIGTTDGGATWNQQYQASNYYDILLSAYFISDSIGWAGGGALPNGTILKTTNGGITWSTQTTNIKQVCSIYFVTDSIGWAIANDGSMGTHYIYKSINGGSTWAVQDSGFDYVRSVYFVDSLVGWVAGDNGNIYSTVDGGNTWLPKNPSVVFHFTSIFSISESVAWAVGHYQYGGCYKTTDGGDTWDPQNVSSLAHLYSVFFTSPDTGWAVGDLGIIMETINGGATWTTHASNTVDGLNSVHFPSNNIGYTVGESGTILKMDTSTTKLDEAILLESVLSVYPNPTTEKFAIQNKSKVPIETQIKIFNVIGEKLFDEKLEIQNFIEIPVSTFEAGIYLLEIETNNGFLNSKLIVQ